MDNKKICLVLPTLTGGGMERVMSELANYFVSLGHEVSIVCLIHHNPFYKLNDDIKLYLPDFGRNQKRGLMYWIKIIFYLRKTILKINPDTVLSIPQGYSNLTIFSLLGSNIPVYVSERNSPNMPVKLRDKLLRKLFYPYATGIIAQTETAQIKLKENGVTNNKIIVIPNPLKKMNYYVPVKNSKVILNVGRLVMEKNHIELIEIFAEINHPDWELHIVGNGPLKNILLNKIQILNMESKVKIFDADINIDVVYSNAEIFAFTSIYEGFPNALNEAMATPLACIAYDCVAGPGELIKNEVNGYLIEFKDRNEYKSKLMKLMNDISIRNYFKMEAKKNRELYSIETIGIEYLNFILGK